MTNNLYYMSAFILALLSAGYLLKTFMSLRKMYSTSEGLSLLGTALIFSYSVYVLYAARGQPDAAYAPWFRLSVAVIVLGIMLEKKAAN